MNTSGVDKLTHSCIHSVIPSLRSFTHSLSGRPKTLDPTRAEPYPTRTLARARTLEAREALSFVLASWQLVGESDLYLKIWGKSITPSTPDTQPQSHCIHLHLLGDINSSYTLWSFIESVPIMLASSSRTALRQAATKQFTVKSGVRAASAWSQVAQGPPVSQ